MQMRQFAYEIRQISWNPPNFTSLNPCFGTLPMIHEIWQISPWNPLNFMPMKSGGFHGHEICRISWWNPPNFTSLNPWFGTLPMIQCMETFCFFTGLIHEIQWISWSNPLDFMARTWVYICIGSDEKYSILVAMKSPEFHEIRRFPNELRTDGPIFKLIIVQNQIINTIDNLYLVNFENINFLKLFIWRKIHW